MADKTMVDYTAKIKPYFQGVAPVEPTTTAAAAYSAGEQFYLDGTLVEALTSIAVGDTLTLNTNYKVVGPIETQLRQVKQALTDEAETRSALGAHNILPIKLSEIKKSNTTGTWSGDTYTISGVAVEFTADNDYVTQIKLNGTASANITSLFLNLHVDLEAGSYICNGNPSGVTGNQYGLRIANANFTINTFFEQGATLTLDSATTDLRVDIRIPSGQVINNVVFKPMIRLATDANADYEPFSKTNLQLTQELRNEVETQALLGAHNLNGTKYNATSLNNVTFTPQSDGTVLVSTSGTSSAETQCNIIGFEAPLTAQVVFSGGVSANAHIYAWDITDSARPYTDSTKSTRQTNNSNGENDAVSFFMEKGHKYALRLRVGNNTSVSGTYKPLLILVTDTDTTYQLYAETNQQLTQNVSELKTGLNNEISARATLGAHNLLPLTLSKIKPLNTHGTWSGNTCVIDGVSFRCDTDDNDIITQIYVSGTNTTGDSNFNIFDYDISGSYILSGCPSGGSFSSYNISTNIDSAWVGNSYDTGNGSDINVSSHLKLVVHIPRNLSEPPALWKPMLRLASDTDSTFAPYAMTNQQLTEALTDLTNVSVTAGTNIVVNSNTHVFKKNGFVMGSLRLEVSDDIAAGSTLATLSEKPKTVIYAIAVSNDESNVNPMPIVITTNGEVALFGGFTPITGKHIIIPLNFVAN